MQNKIVVGYDGTDGAKAALTHALGLAKELGSSVVVAFSYDISAIGGEVKDLSDAVKEIGQKALEEAKQLASAEGVQVETVLVHSKPAEGLVKVSQEHDARMIVVGCYGERPLAGAVLGATPNRLLHLSERPVLVVRIES